jgi:protein-tyrosine phosphatase
MVTVSGSRWVRVTGATNVRDLGGYRAEGGITRWGTIFRADSLHQLSQEDQQMLLDHGVRTVIDLRHTSETDARPNVFSSLPNIRYIPAPIFQGVPPTPDANQPMLDLPTIYRYMVDECQNGFAKALSTIADAGEGSVLFHCSAGKDRTGVLSALLLGLAGVSDETIAEDYALTTQAMLHLRPKLMAQLEATGGDPVMLDRLLSSHPEDMLNLLNYVKERYASLQNYVRLLGLSDAQIERLLEKFIDKSA